MKKFNILALIGVCSLSTSLLADPPAPMTSYENVYISYYTPKNVTSMVQYAKEQKLGGFLLWEVRGDAPYNSDASLLKVAATLANDNASTPLIMAYWTDWSPYWPSTAVPGKPYVVPGSFDPSSVEDKKINNDDFQAKLEGINVLTFSFMEAQTKTYTYYDQKAGKVKTVDNPTYDEQGGTLYFNDPWADLKKGETFCTDDNDPVCWFVDHMQGHKPPSTAWAKMGNLDAMVALQHANSSNPLGPLKKVVSIGGWAHDATFEEAFNTPTHQDNFVNSALRVLQGFKLDGIDLDYENPAMTYEDSEKYAGLIMQLRKAMDVAGLQDKSISFTTMSGPDYLSGKNGIGWKPGVLASIIAVSNNIYLSVMTYDYHGAFDYDPKGNGRTGFLTNLVVPKNKAPDSYDYKFTVQSSVDVVKSLGIPSDKILIGIPAYGRALANISKTSDKGDTGGLYSIIPDNAIIPKGDLDEPTCSQAITPLTGTSCSGSFSYAYILQHMLQNPDKPSDHFVQTEWKEGDISNGTTAYAAKWAPFSGDYKLEVSNLGTGSDLAFNVIIANDSTSLPLGPWFALGSDVTLQPNDLMAIEGKTGLHIKMKIYDDRVFECPSSAVFDFKQNTHIMIRVDNQAKTYCDVKPLP